MAEVDPFDIEFEEEKPKRSIGVFDNAVKKLKNSKKKTEEPEVPEIDTKVVDLPKEDENEKELIVEHNEEPTDKTIAEPTPEEDNSELESFNEEEVVEPPTEENFVSAEEVGDTDAKTKPTEEESEPVEDDGWNISNPKYKDALLEAQALAQNDLNGFRVPKNWEDWTDRQKADSIKAWQNGQENNQEETIETPKQKKSEEDILKEAESIAQQPLPGFIPPPGWEDMSFEEKTRIVKNYLDTKKVEDHSTRETNNFESYKRYPTGLRVAEDVAGVASDIVKGAGDVAKEDIGGTGANLIAERAKGIPHYDYTSLFGRR